MFTGTIFLPITTKFNKGLPPCLFSSSALTSSACRAFAEERPGVGAEGVSSPFDPLEGVSGRLDVASVAFSGLPRRAEVVTASFSPVLRKKNVEGFNHKESGLFCNT